jgi:hypothetical protein
MKTIIIILFGLLPNTEKQFQKLIDSKEIKPTLINDNRQMYQIVIKSDTIDIAYKGEIKNYLKTGKFEFNEFLKD